MTPFSTRSIAIAKSVCLLVALGLITLLVAYSLIKPTGRTIYFKPVHGQEAAQDSLPAQVKSPRLQGYDRQNQPYAIFAEQASQEGNQYIRLDKINADLSSRKGKWFSAFSDSGLLSLKEKTLTLTGSVNFFSDSGMELHTPSASIDFYRGLATGSEPVEIVSANQTLQATGFQLSERGHKITFTGPIRLVLFPQVR